MPTLNKGQVHNYGFQENAGIVLASIVYAIVYRLKI